MAAPFKFADNIAFDNVKYVEDNVVLPVYFNGIADNNQSVVFKYNADILNLESNNPNVVTAYCNDNKTVCIVSTGYFNPNTPIAYITLDNSVKSFDATNVKFYAEPAANVSYK
jgi:hypothetical protein